MLYVARDAEGRVCELHPVPLDGATEEVAADNPEVLQFIHERWRESQLNELDRDFVRVIEDTIELLIAKGVIMFTDLPPKVQEKMLRRKEVRQFNGFETGYGGDDIIPL
ncbi:hypothetical protein ACLIIZ_20165 [Azonexus caeni]|jgi:hypothetical protein|uniref:hypothetical protein n=1 Tax=Azonexus caeni TaxID=266126 RepID=UPI003A84BDD8